MKSARILELPFSTDQLRSDVEARLRAGGLIHDNEEISIEFGALCFKPCPKTIPITIKLKTTERSVLIEH